MRNHKSLLAVALLAAAFTAGAQNGFDLFGIPRVLVVAAPQVLAGASTVTTAVDTHGYEGVANVQFFAKAYGAAGTVTALLETSSDTNTWTAVTYAAAVSASVIYTNSALGSATNVYYTDTYLLPGTWTTPTAATAGWASGYLAPAAFTGTAAVTLTTATYKSLGYQIGDAGRYLRCTFTATDAYTTNCVVGAILIGRRGSEVK